MIEFSNLKKSFGDRQILRGLNLKIPKGQILFILGTSGTGKSVLLKLLVGLLKPTGGTINIGGVDVTDFTEEDFFPIRRKCGMVFQQPALFDSLTVKENVAFGLRRHFPDLPEAKVAQKVIDCLKSVNLEGVESKFPQEISYGMQKRVSLARTLAVDPEILLFDEPTTGLDPISTNAINHLIMNLSRDLNTTSVVVSHDMHCAIEIADYIVVLDQGLIIEEGTPEAIRQSDIPLVKDFMTEVN